MQLGMVLTACLHLFIAKARTLSLTLSSSYLGDIYDLNKGISKKEFKNLDALEMSKY